MCHSLIQASVTYKALIIFEWFCIFFVCVRRIWCSFLFLISVNELTGCTGMSNWFIFCTIFYSCGQFYILYTFQNMQNVIYFTKISGIIQNACYILCSTDLKKIEKYISHKKRLHLHILCVVATKFRTVSTRSCIWLAERRSKVLIFVCWHWAFSLFASLHLSVFTQDLHQTSHSLFFSVGRASSVLDHLIGFLISKAVAFKAIVWFSRTHGGENV